MRWLDKYHILFWATAVALALSSCSSELDVFDPVASKPVVYCILNQDSEVQYLRINKTYRSFDGQGVPASGDSLMLNADIEAVLERIENNDVAESHPFIRTVAEKDSGDFPTTPYWVYSVQHQVVPNSEYRLVIYNNEMDQLLYSSCKSLSDFQIIDPIYPDVREIHFQDHSNPLFRWTGAANAAMYQLGFIVHFLEVQNEIIAEKELLIPIRTTFLAEQQGAYFTLPVNSNQFYKKLADYIENDETVQRKMESVDVIVQAGGEDLSYFIQQQTDADPFRIFEFNNLMNAEGVFSAISVQRINGFKLTDQTVDSLAYGHWTTELNFVDRYGNRKDQ